MRILGVERDTRACNYYRIESPLNTIQDLKLADCRLLDYGSAYDSDENLNKVFETDIVLLPRPSSEEWFGFVRACVKAGKIIVADYDDDPFSCDPMNPYYRWIGVEEWSHPEYGWVWKDGMKESDGTEWFNIEKNINRRDMLRASFKNADLVTCTTKELQDVFKKINKNTEILPNFIDLSFYPKTEVVKKKVRIGWQGGVSHYRDLHFIKDVLEELSKNDDVELIYFGDFRLMSQFKNVMNIRHENWVDHRTYPYKLALLAFDIGICPLVDNSFNRCKSAIKYFEYSAVGSATVASDIPPYNRVITNGQDGVLVPNDTKAWVSVLSELVEKKKKVLELSRNAYENVSKNHTIQKNAHLWVDAYKRVIEKNCQLQGA